jgi:hypothetical protein
LNNLDQVELQARIEAIQSGPWMERAELARRKLSSPGVRFFTMHGTSPMNLGSLHIDPRTAELVKELDTTFKWHGEGRIPTHAERRIRDSFDDALTYLQMIELAIETGYLPADFVAEDMRGEMIRLFWSEPARRFVRIYDYISVEELAMRVELGGFQRRSPRAIDPRGALHFATFLATHRAIEGDANCEKWLEFLDDYVIRRGEQVDFYEFLESGEAARSKRRITLLLGARTFAVMLADFFSTLPIPLQARFGAFYSYWLAKLFAYERRDGGYVRSSAPANGRDCWSNALVNWYRKRTEREGGDDADTDEMALVERSLKVLESTWELVRHSNLNTADAAIVSTVRNAD